jgi:Uma2 family endonuclease
MRDAEVDLYPDSDGRPFDSDWHAVVLTDLLDRLKHRYANDPLVCVCGRLLLYFEEGNPSRRVAPDVSVVPGTPKRDGRHYLSWRERVAPPVVIELTSDLTRDEDWNKKLPVCRDVLRVPEVFIFDPLRDYLDPALQGFRLSDGAYRPISRNDGRLLSEQLGVWLQAEETDLWLIDRATGHRIPGRWERPLGTEIDNLFAEIARLKAERDLLRCELGDDCRPAEAD